MYVSLDIRSKFSSLTLHLKNLWFHFFLFCSDVEEPSGEFDARLTCDHVILEAERSKIIHNILFYDCHLHGLHYGLLGGFFDALEQHELEAAKL